MGGTAIIMIDKRYIIAQEIAHTDYSYFENPLREILEYRKAACEKLATTSEENEEQMFELIEYTNNLLKKYLKIW